LSVALVAVVEGRGGAPGLRAVRASGLTAVVRDARRAAPRPSEAALRRHDAAVRRAARAFPAVVPARFGMRFETDAAVRALLRRHAAALRRALARVNGREQMILRVAVPGGVHVLLDPPAAGRRPGTRHLAARAAAHDPRRLPAVGALLDALSPLVAAERVEANAPPLLSSVYHLVPRGAARAYRRAVAAAALPAALSVRVSGPWAPYAFAPALEP
jgi:hypothetical protein